MSRGAVSNPDRRRELRPIPIPRDVARLLQPGTRGYRMGACQILVSQVETGWHLSITRRDRLPDWEEVRDARYALVPDEAVMAMLLPPRDQYVNAHEFCLQLYEVPAAYLEAKERLP